MFATAIARHRGLRRLRPPQARHCRVRTCAVWAWPASACYARSGTKPILTPQPTRPSRTRFVHNARVQEDRIALLYPFNQPCNWAVDWPGARALTRSARWFAHVFPGSPCRYLGGGTRRKTGAPWLLAAGLLVLGGMMVMTYWRDPVEGDPGTTTVAAVVVCYAFGASVWFGMEQLAVTLAVATTACCSSLNSAAHRAASRGLTWCRYSSLRCFRL